jgi:ABC-type glycerol-3-phosphate transport system substrate-binding protein
MKLRHFLFSLILLSLSILLAGCLRLEKTDRPKAQSEVKELTFYGLFDSEEVYGSMIQTFESEERNVRITYKKFVDPDAYLNLIINELAEGEGPDLFMLHNSWIPKHYKKLSPAPSNVVDPEVFQSLFVDVTGKELIIPDDEGVERVWGLPLYVDTLALYYNDEHIEEALPTQGRPSSTWAGISNDVVALNREDQSFERFERSGIALGGTSNISRSFDILMSLFLQHKVEFYNEETTKSILRTDPNAAAAMDLYASFGLPSQRHYSWNEFLSDENSAEKELTSFARGKVSMIMGYSYTYEDIEATIQLLQRQGEDVIRIGDVKIQETPQVYDPNTSGETREAYASYFVPVVSRTSENSDIAWSFLASMVSEENLRSYNAATNRPSALRSLINEQMNDPIYGIFAAQIGYASPLIMADPMLYKELFLAGLDDILGTSRSTEVINAIDAEIQALIPLNGIKPHATKSN